LGRQGVGGRYSNRYGERRKNTGEDSIHAEDGEDALKLSLLGQYREMANDKEHEKEAAEWIEGLVSDVSGWVLLGRGPRILLWNCRKRAHP